MAPLQPVAELFGRNPGFCLGKPRGGLAGGGRWAKSYAGKPLKEYYAASANLSRYYSVEMLGFYYGSCLSACSKPAIPQPCQQTWPLSNLSRNYSVEIRLFASENPRGELAGGAMGKILRWETFKKILRRISQPVALLFGRNGWFLFGQLPVSLV